MWRPPLKDVQPSLATYCSESLGSLVPHHAILHWEGSEWWTNSCSEQTLKEYSSKEETYLCNPQPSTLNSKLIKQRGDLFVCVCVCVCVCVRVGVRACVRACLSIGGFCLASCGNLPKL
jgi:hypothetical protein